MAKKCIPFSFLIFACLISQAAAQTGQVSNMAAGYTISKAPQEIGDVNSGYEEARPLISKDGSTLYFSRRYHPENAKGEKDFQDVWVSYKDSLSGKWSEPENLGPVINNRKRNAIACLSPDGMDAIFFNTYKKTRKMPLARSRKSGNSWTKPKVMNIENYNNISSYSDFFVSFDQKVLFLAVEADSSVGDQDLYISFLDPYGGWKEPVNLGTTINSGKADFAPFMGADGRSLFFCSYGHEGIGGSDIFMSVRLDDTWLNWSEPVNLGPDINTPEEETYFSLTGDFKYLYYTSYKAKSKDRNILRVELPEDFTGISGPLLSKLDSSALSPLMLSGLYETPLTGKRRETEYGSIALGKTDESTENQDISGINKELDKIVSEEIERALKDKEATEMAAKTTAEVPAHTGEGLSTAALEMQNYLQKAFPDLSFEVAQKQDTVEFKIVQNLLYEFNSIFVNSDYLSRLSKMARILREKPELKVQLTGYTDNVGDEEVNKRVARQRVENLVQYFRDRRIQPERIEIIGAGKANPLASNENEEGRILNRRVETVIRFTE